MNGDMGAPAGSVLKLPYPVATTLSDVCAQCNKPNTWRLVGPVRAIEVCVCRYCRAENHIITAGRA